VTFAVDATDADAAGYEPIWRNGEYVGFVTSGGFGHRVGTSIAMGYVQTDALAEDGVYEISILGERRPARIARGALYDPEGTLARG
jgi:dimethylglycine dehydrogenase